MVIGQLNCTGPKIGNETLFLKRINRWKRMKYPNLKRINPIKRLEILENDHLSLWTSYPMLCFLNTIGVAPFQLDGEKLCIKHSLYSLVYVSFLIILFSSLIIYFSINDFANMHFITMSPLWISCLVVYSNLIFSTHDSKKICLISGKLSQIAEIMCRPTQHSEGYSPKVTIFIILEMVVLSSTLYYIDLPYALNTATLIFIKCHVAFIIIQIYEINLKLKSSFAEVNKNLEKVVDKYEREIFTVRSFLPFVETIGHTERSNELTIPVLIDLHWSLCKTVGMVGDFLGMKVLLVMIYSFVRLINVPFMVITYWANSRDGEKEKIVTMSRKIASVLLCIFEILLLIVPCVLTASEAKKTSKVICALLNRYSPASIRRQLEKSVQLLKLHNAEFSANGLLKFDLSIITSMAGVAATYLIIFVQHQTSTKINWDTNHNGTQNLTLHHT